MTAPDQHRNIVLTGFMGTGKSTVGRLLATATDRRFLDTDAIIEDRHGPIADIFATSGEAAFRAMERAVAGELSQPAGLVVATGGRFLLDGGNAELMAAGGRIFCLFADTAEILRRLLPADGVSQRPLLAGDNPLERITSLLEERSAAYGKFEQVPTTGYSPTEIVDDIVDRCRNQSFDPAK